VLVGALGFVVVGCVGRSSDDAQQGGKPLYIWKRDLTRIHREWDTFWLEDQPTRLTPYRDWGGRRAAGR